jgi:thymidylate kinase
VFITFSGLDGAGKSTWIDWLRARLEAHDLKVVTLHMNDDVGAYAVLRSMRDRILYPQGAPQSPPGQPNVTPTGGVGRFVRKTRDRIVWSKLLRRGVYLLDLVAFVGYRLYHEYVKGRVLILDRYFYDTLVDVWTPAGEGVIRFLERLTPAPAAAIFLDVSAQESFRRKGEYSVEYLENRRVAYHRVFGLLDDAVVVENTDRERTRSALEEMVVQNLVENRAKTRAETSKMEPRP